MFLSYERRSQPDLVDAGIIVPIAGLVSSRILVLRHQGDIAAKFLAAVLAQSKVKKPLSSDHFLVDGTLIEAWASIKSVKPKEGSGEPPTQIGGRNAEAASMARNARTIPMLRPPIPMPSSTTRAKPRRRSFASSGMG
jgi:hypothetical protein